MNALDPSIRSQWPGPLTMAYHWWKHERDFGGTPATIGQYFTEYSNNLFRTENVTSISYNQSGLVKNIYLTSFGARTHFGISVDKTIATHFVK